MAYTRLWYEHDVFVTFDSECRSFTLSIEFYRKNGASLDEMSIIRGAFEIPTEDLLRRMIVSFSHQSCLIEGNSLGIAESRNVWDKMNRDHNIDELLREEAQLPFPTSLLEKPGKEIE